VVAESQMVAAPGQAVLAQESGGPGLGRKVSSALRWLPSYAWQRLTRRTPRGHVHLIFALADHFEPGIVPEDGAARAPHDEQERRLDRWCRDYPKLVDPWRDSDGRAMVHTYFYPAEQYHRGLIERLVEHCHAGWGEIEIHLHHGAEAPDTPENTRRQLVKFRDALVERQCLAYWDGSGPPRYAFVHGNFALSNSAGGRFCGVDSEMQILAETGCYADFTLPAGAFDPSQVAKINSLYECAQPLHRKAAHSRGLDLRRGHPPTTFPLLVQGPLLPDFDGVRPLGLPGIEDSAITGARPPSLRRLQLWKRAAIAVRGRPDWIFIKLHCHGMDPRPKHEDAMLGAAMRRFLQELVEGAPERGESIHFVSAREMVNIAVAACDGREGNPGQYRDYRLRLVKRTQTTGALQHRG
jgi:hypothetical protein